MSYKWLIVVFLLILSLVLRLHRYQEYPQRGATSDEYTYSFLGISLLTSGKPVSWSFFAYPSVKPLVIDKMYFPIVEPYFDHPPLYGLLVGGWAILNNEHTFQSVQLSVIRLVPIALSVATSLFVFLIAKSVWNYQTGIFALAIYATSTVFAISGRAAVSENLVAFWFVLATYLFVIWEKNITKKRAIILGCICGLSFLTQIISTALFAGVLTALILSKRKTKIILKFGAAFVVFVILYLLYGAYFGWDTFMKINLLQGARPIGPLTFWYIFSNPIIINKIYFDGWYLFGFLSLLIFMFDPKNILVKLIPLSYILFLIFTLTEQGQSGWYIIPLFAFMALAAGKSIYESIQQRSLFFVVPILFAGLYEINVFRGESINSLLFRVAVGLLIIPSLLSIWGKWDKKGVVLNIYFWLLILVNAFITWKYVHPA